MMSSKIPIHAVVHARMSSVRLPGKVLYQIHGKPLLGHLIDRLERCAGLDGMIIATSTDSADDAIANYASERRIGCSRGSLQDVAGRVVQGAHLFGIEHLVRISGDSPMLDPAVVTELLDIYRQERPDLATNVQKRTFPRGQSVEIFAREVLESAWLNGMSAADQEHVTTWFYRHPEKYIIRNVAYSRLRGDAQLSVDTEQDLARFEQILSRLGEPHWQHGIEALLQTFDALTRVENENA